MRRVPSVQIRANRTEVSAKGGAAGCPALGEVKLELLMPIESAQTRIRVMRQARVRILNIGLSLIRDISFS